MKVTCFLGIPVSTVFASVEESEFGDERSSVGTQGYAWQATETLARQDALVPGISRPHGLPTLCSDNPQGALGQTHFAFLVTEI